MGWLISIINRRFRRYSRRIQDSVGDVTRVSKESFEAPRLIKVYNAQEHLDRQFDAVNQHNLRSNMRLVLTRSLANPIVQTRDRARRRRRSLHSHRGCHRRTHDHGRSARIFRGAGQHRTAVARAGRRQRRLAERHRRRPEPVRVARRAGRVAGRRLHDDPGARRGRVRERVVFVRERQRPRAQRRLTEGRSRGERRHRRQVGQRKIHPRESPAAIL